MHSLDLCKGVAKPLLYITQLHQTLNAPSYGESKFVAEKNSWQSDHEKYCGVGRSSFMFHPTRFNPTA